MGNHRAGPVGDDQVTARTLAPVDSATIERLAFNSGADIEIDTANARAYLTIGATTFVAELGAEVTC